MKSIRIGLSMLLLATVGAGSALAAQSLQIPLAGKLIPKFVDPLPDLLDANHRIEDDGVNVIELEMREHLVNILPAGVVPNYAGTYVWSYLKPGQQDRNSYIGPVIVATRGTPTEIKFVNKLGTVNMGDTGTDTNVLAYKYSTDQTLHWADPLKGEANMCNHMVMFPTPGEVAGCDQNYSGPIPAAVHLHGGEVPPQLDGGPDSWFTSDGMYKGHGFYSKDGTAATNYATYRYPNSQEGALIWFHDHTLGATRLNVYAGLAGAYLITDPVNDPKNLPPPVPLVIQDRMFDTNGQLFFPSDTAANILWTPNPEHPYWVPEFVGDVIVVNGKAWPFLNVEPKRYTFLFLNGSNARTYEMVLIDPVSGNRGPAFWVIGTDGGYLDKPVKVGGTNAGNNLLVMMSGERYQAIIDFAGFQAGVIGPNGLPYSGTWLLKNSAKTPFPGGAAAQGGTTAQIMQFRVVGTPGSDTTFNPAAVPTPAIRLANPIVRLPGAPGGPAIVTTGATPNVQKTRQLTLNEVMGMPQAAANPVTGVMTNYPGGPLEILVNNTKWNGERVKGALAGMYTFETRPDFTLDGSGKNWISEKPNEGETEVWEIVNLTADAHPIHLHLVQFQLMNRQNFDVKAYTAAYGAEFPGGGYDPMTGLPYPAGVFIPGFGPPLNYNTGIMRAFGGNPDIAAVAKGKPMYLKGAPAPPLPQEAGWKDTVTMYPGQVTRIAVRWAPTHLSTITAAANLHFPFDPSGNQEHGYVWHCHIIDHEDNEMMRPTAVSLNTGAPDAGSRFLQKGRDY